MHAVGSRFTFQFTDEKFKINTDNPQIPDRSLNTRINGSYELPRATEQAEKASIRGPLEK
jgi:hypothetical protein